MGKIVVNKNFQSKYLYKAFERLVKPDYSQLYVSGLFAAYGNSSATDQKRSPYIDLSSGLTNYWSGINGQDGIILNLVTSVTTHLICTETYLTVLNKINKALKNNTLPNVPSNSSAGSGFAKTLPPFIPQLVDTLFSTNVTYRNNGYKYFYNAGIITQDEYNYILSNTSGVRRVSVSNVNTAPCYPYVYEPFNGSTTTVSNNSIDINTNEVLRLDTPLKNITNTKNEQMYIVIIPLCDVKFSNLSSAQPVAIYRAGTLEDKGYSITPASYNTALFQYATFHNKVANTVVPQIPYIALSLTEVGAGGDIEYDHLDEIEYLDEIKITINLPKEYN